MLIVSLVQCISPQPGQDQWSIVVIHAGSFAILYVWIISAVCLSCIIGVSQFELAIPRILDRLQHDLKQRIEKDAAGEMQRTSKSIPFATRASAAAASTLGVRTMAQTVYALYLYLDSQCSPKLQLHSCLASSLHASRHMHLSRFRLHLRPRATGGL